MSGAHIVTRHTKSGPRYLVRYRKGGRAYRLVHAGSFKTKTEARQRRDLIAGWLAAGRDPQHELAQLAALQPERTIGQWADAWLTTLIHLAPSSRQTYEHHLKRIRASFDTPSRIQPHDIQEWIGALVDEGLKPSSVSRIVQVLAALLDFTEIQPNPARHKSVRLPRLEREEPQPPTAPHVLAVLDRVARKYKLPIATMEQAAMRSGEVETLEWRDVDVHGLRFRLRSRETKTAKARWAQIPGWLMRLIEASCPVEDRTPTRRVFMGYTTKGAYAAVARACRLAQIPHWHPHDLRHRRASLWHGQGLSARELQERGGWSNATEPLNTYAHIMPLEEIVENDYMEALAL